MPAVVRARAEGADLSAGHEKDQPGGQRPDRLPTAVAPRRRRLAKPLATTSWSLIANTLTTSALGVVFWAVASRLYSPAELGESAALISAMILLSTVSQLNLGMGIPRLLPQVRHRPWRPVLAAYALTAVVGAGVTTGFLAAVGRLSGDLAFLGRDTTLGLALIGAVVLWNIFALQDAVLTSARWAVVVPIENGLFGVLKIGLMVALAAGSARHGVFVAWLLAMALLLLPISGLIFGKVLPSRGAGQEQMVTNLPLGEPRRIARYLAIDYVAALLSQGSTALLPLLVIGILGGAENAYFYSAFLITSAVGALAHGLSTSLVSEAAHDEEGLLSLARDSLVRYSRFVAPAVALGILAAPLLMAPFGEGYVTNGTTLLRLLLAGTIPQALITMYLGVERVRARVFRILFVEAATVTLVITGAVVGMRWYGLVGLGVAWLVAQTCVAALIAPRLWQVIHRTDRGRLKNRVVADLADSEVMTSDLSPSASSSWWGDVGDLAAAMVTALLLLLAGLGMTGVVRIALALIFITFVPGWTLLNHVSLARSVPRMAVAAAVSLTLATMAASVAVWLGMWHPRVMLDVAGATCLVSLTWRLSKRRAPGDVAAAGVDVRA